MKYVNVLLACMANQSLRSINAIYLDGIDANTTNCLKTICNDKIIDLLLHKENGDYVIREIKGGGYAPERNFKISDLTKSNKEKLYMERPDLASLKEYYDLKGNDGVFKLKFQRHLNKNFGESQYDLKEDYMWLWLWNGVEQLVSEADLKELNNYSEYQDCITG